MGIPRDIGTINSMYWDFLSRNRRELSKNPRIAIMYGTHDRMNIVRKVDLLRQAEQYRASVHHL